jgi:hypothetical protein
VAPETSEAAGQPPAAQELAEFRLDKPGQSFSVAQTGRLRAKRLEVIADHLIQHTLRGRPRLVHRR